MNALSSIREEISEDFSRLYRDACICLRPADRTNLHPNCDLGIGNAADDQETLHQWSTYLATQTLDLVQLCAR